jgi:hypothetical protein
LIVRAVLGFFLNSSKDVKWSYSVLLGPT